MFVYERDNSIFVNFKGNLPNDSSEVIIKGYKNGAELIIMDSVEASVRDAEEFECKAKTFVYQKDNKLMITFHGIEGMSSPEVIIDEQVDGTVEIIMNQIDRLIVSYDADSAYVLSKDQVVTTVEEQPLPSVEEPEVIEEEPEEVVEN